MIKVDVNNVLSACTLVFGNSRKWVWVQHVCETLALRRFGIHVRNHLTYTALVNTSDDVQVAHHGGAF